MPAPGGGRAADVFVAALVPRQGGRLLRSARLLAAFAAELAWGLLPAPSLSDVVVTRRRDGVELVRVEAGDPNVPGEMLGLVQRQLDALDPAAFLAEWGARDPDRGAAGGPPAATGTTRGRQRG